ncbi:MAG: hypothetical protein QM731_04460 [Chitinophagaceae bacterium]
MYYSFMLLTAFFFLGKPAVVDVSDSYRGGVVCMTQESAEKILGQKVQVTENTTVKGEGVTKYNCTYRAVTADGASGKTGNLYFSLEVYDTPSHAAQAYSVVKTSNQAHQGFQQVKDAGDEAYVQADGSNFYFMMARKGTRIMKMKVNKVTSKSSWNVFQNEGKSICGKM